MKLTHAIPVVISTVILALVGCNKVPDEKTAIANFNSDIESFGKWAGKHEPDLSKPAATSQALSEFTAKLKSIRTDGLPADLKAGWGDMSAAMVETGDIFKNMPKPDPSKPADMRKVWEELLPKIKATQSKLKPVGDKMDELGKKYGIDMSKIKP